jgi:integrase
LMGLYTGQRLRDIASVTWAQVDLDEGAIRFTTSKTGRHQVIPMVPAVVSFLSERPSSDDPAAAVFPNAAAVVRRNRTTSALSGAFHGILVRAGLVEARPSKHGRTSGLGRSGRRQQNELSFHSLRHTATTMLKMCGAAEATVREIVGHSSATVSRLYTHVGDRDKREALTKLAALDLGGGAKQRV